MRYLIFMNIKRYLSEFGYEVLDFVVNPANPTSFIPKERYNNLGMVFKEHINNTEINKSNFRKMLPLLTINIHDLGTIKGCMHQYMVEFTYSFVTTSGDNPYCIRNNTEVILRHEDKFNCALNNMMFKKIYDDKGRLKTRNIFQFMCYVKDKIECFDGCICCVSSIQEDPLSVLSVEDEVITINKQYIIDIGEC